MQEKILELKAHTLFAVSRFARKNKALHQSRIETCLALQAKATSPIPSRQPDKLPTLQADEVTPERFLEASQNYTLPVLLKGLVKDAISTQTWSLDYFIDNYGSAVYTGAAKANIEPTAIRAVLEDIKKSKDSPLYDHYFAGITQIFEDYPRLKKEMGLDRLLAIIGEADESAFKGFDLCMGSDATGSSMHCAMAGNFFNNIVGRKEWILISPEHTRYLLPLAGDPFLFAHAYFDAGNPDLNSFTQRVPHYKVVLEPGDVLFNASWWWHCVKNLERFNVGCAVRFPRLGADFANNFLFMLLSDLPMVIAREIKAQLTQSRLKPSAELVKEPDPVKNF